MNNLMDKTTHSKRLGEFLRHSFSGYNSSLDMERLLLFIKSLTNEGIIIRLETSLTNNTKYAFKTVVLNLEDYLGYKNTPINYELIHSFLDEEKAKSVHANHLESATIIAHIKNRISGIEKSNKGTYEIADLFQLLPPYKLMKYDIKESDKEIILTVITGFEPFLINLKEIINNISEQCYG